MAKKKDDVPSLLEQISGLGPTRLGRNDPNSAANTMPSLNKIGQMGEPSFEEDPTIEKSQHKIYVERLGEQRRFARPSEQYEEKYATLQVIEKSIRGLKLDIKQIYNTTSSPFAGQPGAERLHAEYIDKLQTGIKVGEDERDRIKADLIARDARNVTRFHGEIGTHMQGEWSPSKLGGEEKRLRASDPNIHMAALPYASQDWGVLQERKREIEKTQRYREQEALSEVQQETIGTKEIGMGPINVTQLTQHATTRDVAYADRNRLVKETAIINAALAIKKHRGEDPESMMSEMIRREEGIQGIVNRADMAKQLQETRGVSIKSTSIDPELFGKEQKVATSDINTELITQSKLYLEAMKGLTETTAKINDLFGQTDDELETMKENFQAVTKTSGENVDTLQKAKRLKDDDSSGRKRQIADIANTVSTVLQAASGTISAVGVQQPMTEMANIAGFANIENQKYAMYRKAAHGDVASMMLLSQWQGAESKGADIRSAQQAANIVGAIGSGAQVVAGGVLASTGGIGAINAAGMIGQGVANMTTQVSDIFRGTSANAAQIQATQASIEARRALMTIPAEQMQSYRNMVVGTGAVAREMGVERGTEFLNSTVNQADLTSVNTYLMQPGQQVKSLFERAAEARMSPDEYIKAAQYGVQEIGSVFREDQPIIAKNLEQAGFGKADTQMQRMAALTQAGGNNPAANLASVLEVAVAKGVTNSTAMTKLVDNTATTAQASTLRYMGIDVTAAAAQVTGATIDRTDPNQAYQVQRAATVNEIVSRTETDVGVNWASLVANARLRKATGLGYTQGVIAEAMPTEDIIALRQQLQSNDPEVAARAVEALRDKGLLSDKDANIEKAKKLTDTMAEQRMIKGLAGGNLGMALAGSAAVYGEKIAKQAMEQPETIDDIVKKIYENKALIPNYKFEPGEEQWIQSMKERFGIEGVAGREGVKRVLVAGAINADPTATTKVKAGMETPSRGPGPWTDAFDIGTAGAVTDWQQIGAGKKGLETARPGQGPLRALGEATRDIERGGQIKEDTATTAAAKSAETFGKDTQTFSTAVGKFDAAVNRMLGELGEKRQQDFTPGEIEKIEETIRMGTVWL